MARNKLIARLQKVAAEVDKEIKQILSVFGIYPMN